MAAVPVQHVEVSSLALGGVQDISIARHFERQFTTSNKAISSVANDKVWYELRESPCESQH